MQYVGTGEPWSWTDDQWNEWADEMMVALAANGVISSVPAILINASVFYDWAQGDLTLEQVTQIVNRCDRQLMEPTAFMEGR